MYKEVTYMLDNESYDVTESQDLVLKRFIRLWSTLMDGFKVSRLACGLYLLYDQLPYRTLSLRITIGYFLA